MCIYLAREKIFFLVEVISYVPIYMYHNDQNLTLCQVLELNFGGNLSLLFQQSYQQDFLICKRSKFRAKNFFLVNKKTIKGGEIIKMINHMNKKLTQHQKLTTLNRLQYYSSSTIRVLNQLIQEQQDSMKNTIVEINIIYDHDIHDTD